MASATQKNSSKMRRRCAGLRAPSYSASGASSEGKWMRRRAAAREIKLLALDQIGGQRLFEGFVVEAGEHGVHDLAQALRAELAELAVDGHAAPDVYRGERRVGRLFDRGFVFNALPNRYRLRLLAVTTHRRSRGLRS